MTAFATARPVYRPVVIAVTVLGMSSRYRGFSRTDPGIPDSPAVPSHSNRYQETSGSVCGPTSQRNSGTATMTIVTRMPAAQM